MDTEAQLRVGKRDDGDTLCSEPVNQVNNFSIYIVTAQTV